MYALWDSRAHTSTLVVVSAPDNCLEFPLEKLYPPCPGDVNCVVDIAVHDDGKCVVVVVVVVVVVGVVFVVSSSSLPACSRASTVLVLHM